MVLPLSRLEARFLFIDDVKTAFAPNDTTVTLSVLCCLEGVSYFHELDLYLHSDTPSGISNFGRKSRGRFCVGSFLRGGEAISAWEKVGVRLADLLLC